MKDLNFIVYCAYYKRRPDLSNITTQLEILHYFREIIVSPKWNLRIRTIDEMIIFAGSIEYAAKIKAFMLKHLERCEFIVSYEILSTEVI